MERVLIWASGYNTGLFAEYGASGADRCTLRKVGGALLFSAMWFATMTALAAWTMAFQATTGTRIGITTSAFAGALAFVLTFDRGFVFGIDTCVVSVRKAFLYGTARVLVVVAVGALVDVALMPLVMREELQLEATKMREAAEETRFATLTRRYDVSGRQAELAAARTELDNAKGAAATLPANISSAIASARRCYAALPPQGFASYAAHRQRCVVQQRSAEAARTEYQHAADKRLATATTGFDDASATYKQARNTAAARMETAADEYATFYDAANFGVFTHLVSTQVGAALKAIFLMIAHLSFDLMPFAVKSYFGRTGVGKRIRVRKQAESFDAEAELEAAHADYIVRAETSVTTAAAARAALARPSMVRFAEDMAEYVMRASEPLEQARVTMRRAAAAEQEIEQVKVSTPGMRQFRLELWAQAVADSLRAVGARAAV